MAFERLKQHSISTFFFIGLFILYAMIALQGPIENPIHNPLTNSILKDSLFSLGNFDISILTPRYQLIVKFLFQISMGFMGAYVLGKTFRDLFLAGPLTGFLVTMTFLSPYYYPVIFGEYLITDGYAYPFFLITIRFLLKGMVFRDKGALLLFYLLVIVDTIMHRQFMFLSIVGLLSLIYVLSYDYGHYYGHRMLLILACIASFVVPDVAERTDNLLQGKGFTSVPYAGLQFSVLPLYVSKTQDATAFHDPNQKAFFTGLHQQLEENRLTAAQNKNPKNVYQEYLKYFDDYTTITYKILIPLFRQMKVSDPLRLDQGMITVSLILISQNLGTYFDFYIHNIIRHMGGYFMFSLLWVVLLTSLFYHAQARSRFSLLAALITVTMLANYCLVAFLEPVTKVYGFYTDVLWQGLLLMLLEYLFKEEKRKLLIDSYTQNTSLWKRAVPRTQGLEDDADES